MIVLMIRGQRGSHVLQANHKGWVAYILHISLQKREFHMPKSTSADLFSIEGKTRTTRQSKQCGFSIYIFDNSKSKSMVRLVRSEKMALSGLVFARKIARMILIQNI